MFAALWEGGERLRRSIDGAFYTRSDCVAQEGHFSVVKALIKAGAALDATGYLGWTALQFAALSPRARWSGAGLARTRLTLIGAFHYFGLRSAGRPP